MAFFTLGLKLSVNKCMQVRKYMSLADLTITEILCNCICVCMCVCVWASLEWRIRPLWRGGFLVNAHTRHKHDRMNREKRCHRSNLTKRQYVRLICDRISCINKYVNLVLESASARVSPLLIGTREMRFEINIEWLKQQYIRVITSSWLFWSALYATFNGARFVRDKL